MSTDSQGCKPRRSSRGSTFEKYLNKVVDNVQARGYHAHKNHAQRTFDGKFIRGEPFDYEIFLPEVKYCFDAKECKSNRWSLQNAKPQQVNALKQCKNVGFTAFFLVYFYTEKKAVAYDVDLIIDALDSGTSSLKAEDGVDFEWHEIISG